MIFNKMIPELSVFNIEESKKFYIDVLGAKIEYERQTDKFVFFSIGENQLMLEEIHEDGWNIGNLSYPLGQGMNLSLEVKNVEEIYARAKKHHINLYREMMTSHYLANDKMIEQKEFLLQDPNGYLLRFTN